MWIVIEDNKNYRDFLQRNYSRNSYSVKCHYSPGEKYEVIPYRHNPTDYYEVDIKNLTDEQYKRSPKITGSVVFWIDKKHTRETSPDIRITIDDELFEL